MTTKDLYTLLTTPDLQATLAYHQMIEANLQRDLDYTSPHDRGERRYILSLIEDERTEIARIRRELDARAAQ